MTAVWFISDLIVFKKCTQKVAHIIYGKRTCMNQYQLWMCTGLCCLGNSHVTFKGGGGWIVVPKYNEQNILTWKMTDLAVFIKKSGKFEEI